MPWQRRANSTSAKPELLLIVGYGAMKDNLGNLPNSTTIIQIKAVKWLDIPSFPTHFPFSDTMHVSFSVCDSTAGRQPTAEET